MGWWTTLQYMECVSVLYAVYKRSKNDLDGNLDSNLDCDLDGNPEDVPVYTGHSLNTTKRITLLFIVQSFLRSNPPNIWIRII